MSSRILACSIIPVIDDLFVDGGVRGVGRTAPEERFRVALEVDADLAFVRRVEAMLAEEFGRHVAVRAREELPPAEPRLLPIRGMR